MLSEGFTLMFKDSSSKNYEERIAHFNETYYEMNQHGGREDLMEFYIETAHKIKRTVKK